RDGEGDRTECGGGDSPLLRTLRQAASPHRHRPAAGDTSPTRGGAFVAPDFVAPQRLTGACQPVPAHAHFAHKGEERRDGWEGVTGGPGRDRGLDGPLL